MADKRYLEWPFFDGRHVDLERGQGRLVVPARRGRRGGGVRCVPPGTGRPADHARAGGRVARAPRGACPPPLVRVERSQLTSPARAVTASTVERVSAPAPTRVAIVEDHRMVAEGIAMALAAADDVDVVGVGASVADARALVARHRPEVLLLDHRLPDGEGVALAAELAAVPGAPRIVIVTSHADGALARQAFEGGCRGFIVKHEGLDARIADHGRRVAVPRTGARVATLGDSGDPFLDLGDERPVEAVVVVPCDPVAGTAGVTDAVTGQALVAFVMPSGNGEVTASALRDRVAREIGPVAKPRHIVVVPDLPKTRSGKNMRRLLAQLWEAEQDRRAGREPEALGDTTSLQNPDAVSGVAAALTAYENHS